MGGKNQTKNNLWKLNLCLARKFPLGLVENFPSNLLFSGKLGFQWNAFFGQKCLLSTEYFDFFSWKTKCLKTKNILVKTRNTNAVIIKKGWWWLVWFFYQLSGDGGSSKRGDWSQLNSQVNLSKMKGEKFWWTNNWGMLIGLCWKRCWDRASKSNMLVQPWSFCILDKLEKEKTFDTCWSMQLHYNIYLLMLTPLTSNPVSHNQERN